MINYKNFSSFILPLLLFGSIFISCNDDITVSNNVNDDEYVDVAQQYLALRSYNSSSEMQNVELRDKPMNLVVYLRQAQATNADLTGTIAVDPAALTDYNAKNGSSYEIFPADLVTISNTSATIPAGKTQSDSTGIIIKDDASLVVGTSYILPITFTRAAGSDIANSKDSYLFIVKYMGAIPSAAKASGIATIFFIEVNNVNPLNVGEITLQNSGKPLADIVSLFSANINFNSETGKVYVKMNPNVTTILSHKKKYIKPLQDKGIKVVLSILGNHDGSGVANLSDDAARDYAKQLKAIVDAYDLDGIAFDDEWSKYGENNLHLKYPGFVSNSQAAYARLCYETKKLMRDKLLIVYHIGNAGFNFQVDGEDPGSFIDYTTEAYYGSPNTYIWSSYLGMTKKQNAPYARNMTNGLSVTSYNLSTVVNGGYGAFMIYNLTPEKMEITSTQTSFNTVSNALYNENVVFSGTTFAKDW